MAPCRAGGSYVWPRLLAGWKRAFLLHGDECHPCRDARVASHHPYVYPRPTRHVTAGRESPGCRIGKSFPECGDGKRAFGGTTRTGVPEARLLTCFITSFTLVFISSTTRFTPKAPGVSCSRIYQQEGKKLQETHTSSHSPKYARLPSRLWSFELPCGCGQSTHLRPGSQT